MLINAEAVSGNWMDGMQYQELMAPLSRRTSHLLMQLFSPIPEIERFHIALASVSSSSDAPASAAAGCCAFEYGTDCILEEIVNFSNKPE